MSMLSPATFRIVPDLRRKRVAVHLQTRLDRAVRVRLAGQESEIPAGAAQCFLDASELAPWSPAQPALHAMEIACGEAMLHLAVGMREYGIKDRRFHLNGRPVEIRGVRHRVAVFPDSSEAAQREAARVELQLAREAGFNLIELEGPPSCIWIEEADRAGVLVTVDLGRVTLEMLDALLPLRNHPALVAWGCEAQNLDEAEHCLGILRRFDDSRVLLLRPGTAEHGAAWHARPFRTELEEMDSYRVRLGFPAEPEQEAWLRHLGRPERMAVVSVRAEGLADGAADSSGAASALHAAQQEHFAARELERSFGSWQGFVNEARTLQFEAARCHLDALRVNAAVAGYTFGMLCDTPEGVPGLLDMQRRPTPVFEVFKRLHAPVRPIIVMQETNLLPRQETNVSVLMANEQRCEERIALMLQVVGPTNQVLWKKRRELKVPRHGKTLWEGRAGASGSTGLHRFVVRMTQGDRVIGEASLPFQVVPPLQSSGVAVNIVDPRGEWTSPCEKWTRSESLLAPLHVIPPLSNTIRAYPDNELMQSLAQVRGGAVGIVFSPPEDWNDLTEIAEELPRATSVPVGDAEAAALLFAKLHPLFEGLPSRCLLRQSYRMVAPRHVFREFSEEDICGAWWPKGLRGDLHAMLGDVVLTRRYGSGLLVFCQLRLLDALDQDPVAVRLFVNLIRHAAQRAVPNTRPMPLHQRAVEWMRNERNVRVRRWMCIGPFPNSGGTGHDTAYPPESGIDLGQACPGAYGVVSGRSWCSVADEAGRHGVDLRAATEGALGASCGEAAASSYAYAEFMAERRQEVALFVTATTPLRVWLNGSPLSVNQSGHSNTAAHHGLIRQGKNILLVKCSCERGPLGFNFELLPVRGEPLGVTWWR